MQHIRLPFVYGCNRGVPTTQSIHLTCLVGVQHQPIQPQTERFVERVLITIKSPSCFSWDFPIEIYD
jgi:hypothetical protein